MWKFLRVNPTEKIYTFVVTVGLYLQQNGLCILHVLLTTAAAEDTRTEETNVDECEPTAASASSDNLYMEANPANRSCDPIYKQLDVKKLAIDLQSSPIYCNLPHPNYSTDA